MIRVACAIAVAAMAYTALPAASIAAPISPISAAGTIDAGSVVPVHYWHGHYYRYRWHGHYYHHRHYGHGHWRYW